MGVFIVFVLGLLFVKVNNIQKKSQNTGNVDTPFIGENGNWWIGDTDTGVQAQGPKGETGENGIDGENGQNGTSGIDGLTPFIGHNGNWWIGTLDTGVQAQGEKGEDGTSIAVKASATDCENYGDGYIDSNGNLQILNDIENKTFTNVGPVKGPQGDDGEDGLTPFIGSNGNWWIGSTDTGIQAQGEKGDAGENGENGTNGTNGLTPFIGENGNWWIGTTDTGVQAQGLQGDTGATGQDGKDGADGQNGLTPFIGNNGNWWIGTKDTGVQAQGEKGDTGSKGETGATGTNGLTPYIGTNGNWWIGTNDTGVSARGIKGDTGATGSKGDTGRGIKSIEINDNNEMIVYFTDNTSQNVGGILFNNEDETDGLDYYLLPDDTYGVKAGNTIYLSSITIPEKHNGKNVTVILESAFEEAQNLKSIIMPNTITKIESRAFYNCKKLESITFSENVQSIGEYSFYKCCNLDSVLTIPKETTIIGSFAFGECTSITELNIGEKLNIVSSYAFENCTGINKVNISGSKTWSYSTYYLHYQSSFTRFDESSGAPFSETITISNSADCTKYWVSYTTKTIKIPNNAFEWFLVYREQTWIRG